MCRDALLTKLITKKVYAGGGTWGAGSKEDEGDAATRLSAPAFPIPRQGKVQTALETALHAAVDRGRARFTLIFMNVPLRLLHGCARLPRTGCPACQTGRGIRPPPGVSVPSRMSARGSVEAAAKPGLGGSCILPGAPRARGLSVRTSRGGDGAVRESNMEELQDGQMVVRRDVSAGAQ